MREFSCSGDGEWTLGVLETSLDCHWREHWSDSHPSCHVSQGHFHNQISDMYEVVIDASKIISRGMESM